MPRGLRVLLYSPLAISVTAGLGCWAAAEGFGRVCVCVHVCVMWTLEAWWVAQHVWGCVGVPVLSGAGFGFWVPVSW